MISFLFEKLNLLKVSNRKGQAENYLYRNLLQGDLLPPYLILINPEIFVFPDYQGFLVMSDWKLT